MVATVRMKKLLFLNDCNAFKVSSQHKNIPNHIEPEKRPRVAWMALRRIIIEQTKRFVNIPIYTRFFFATFARFPWRPLR